ncbi:MAG: AAA family ATPase, partial [bacterium]|nr:AAA family ATPase [bacterium]
MRVYLTGFSGSGKTTVGKLLAKSMKCRFIDVDLLVEERSGMSISEIFRLKGEGGFRTLEQKAIVDIRNNADHDLVVALGGGALQSPDIRKLVLGDGQTAYLSCSARELYRRLNPADDRPLLYVR